MATRKFAITLEGKEYIVDVREVIEKKDIAEHITGIEFDSAQFTGSSITPSVIDDGTVRLNSDYSVEYINNVSIGIATVSITGIGEYYEGSMEFTFTITDDIGNHITGVFPESAPYTGEEITPSVYTDGTVFLSSDFLVSYENNIEISDEAKVIVTGVNFYTGTKEILFSITEPENSSEEDPEPQPPIEGDDQELENPEGGDSEQTPVEDDNQNQLLEPSDNDEENPSEPTEETTPESNPGNSENETEEPSSEGEDTNNGTSTKEETENDSNYEESTEQIETP